MIAIVTIIHLSAYRFVFEGKKLESSREKIRLSMGTLKRLSEYWNVGKGSYREVGTIACKILSLRKDETPSPQAPPPLELPFEVFQPQFDASTLGTIPGPDFDFCAYFDTQPSDTFVDVPGLFT